MLEEYSISRIPSLLEMVHMYSRAEDALAGKRSVGILYRMLAVVFESELAVQYVLDGHRVYRSAECQDIISSANL